MTRELRVKYPGVIYHVMTRGDRRGPTVPQDRDRQLFLDTLSKACVQPGWQMHAYWLMGNHSRFLVETPQGNLVAG